MVGIGDGDRECERRSTNDRFFDPRSRKLSPPPGERERESDLRSHADRVRFLDRSKLPLLSIEHELIAIEVVDRAGEDGREEKGEGTRRVEEEDWQERDGDVIVGVRYVEDIVRM